MKEETYPFVMRALPYEPYELAPCISAESTLYHHDRLYKAYVDQLNAGLESEGAFGKTGESAGES